MKFNTKMLKDILTEKIGEEKLYSQARVYLLVSVIAYYVTLGIISFKALKPNQMINEESLKTIIDALQWAMALFAGYSFGHKIVEGFKNVLGGKSSDDTDVTTTTTTTVTPTQTPQ